MDGDGGGGGGVAAVDTESRSDGRVEGLDAARHPHLPPDWSQ